jgi:hypothetical protein
MFDGKMLRDATGTPMRSTQRANNSLALADPEPLTFANLTTKSLVAEMAHRSASRTAKQDCHEPESLAATLERARVCRTIFLCVEFILRALADNRLLGSRAIAANDDSTPTYRLRA